MRSNNQGLTSRGLFILRLEAAEKAGSKDQTPGSFDVPAREGR